MSKEMTITKWNITQVIIYRRLHKRISRLFIHVTASSLALCSFAIFPLNLVLEHSSMMCDILFLDFSFFFFASLWSLNDR